MKVRPDLQRTLLDVADADAELARLDHRLNHLPEDAEIDALDQKIDAARDDLVSAEISAEDLDREYRRLDTEMTGMTNREAKDSAQLTGGGLAAKALSELQHELAGLGRRRAMLEEELIELMERQEALESERQRASATIAHLESELVAAQDRRTASTAKITEQLSAATERREQLVVEVPTELLAIYDKQRASGHVGAGLLRARRCGACRMELDRGTLAGISAKDADEVVRCEECGAILIRTNESGLP